MYVNVTEIVKCGDMTLDMMEGIVVSDMEWKEANSLAGLFQKIVVDCKVRHIAKGLCWLVCTSSGKFLCPHNYICISSYKILLSLYTVTLIFIFIADTTKNRHMHISHSSLIKT